MNKLFVVKIKKEMIIQASSFEDAESRAMNYLDQADGSVDIGEISSIPDVTLAGFDPEFEPVNGIGLTIEDILNDQ